MIACLRPLSALCLAGLLAACAGSPSSSLGELPRTPQASIDRFAAALMKVVALPDVHAKLTGWGLTVTPMSQAALAQRERAYRDAWARIIRDSGFQPQ